MKAFVYGTLMRGRSNHRHLRGCAFTGKAELRGFALYNVGKYAAIKPLPGCVVKGEIFEVNDNARARLDRVEEEGGLYTAQNVSVTLEDGKEYEAFVYVYNRDVSKDDFVRPEMQPWNRTRALFRV